jgi:hypothetical protein
MDGLTDRQREPGIILRRTNEKSAASHSTARFKSLQEDGLIVSR